MSSTIWVVYQRESYGDQCVKAFTDEYDAIELARRLEAEAWDRNSSYPTQYFVEDVELIESTSS